MAHIQRCTKNFGFFVFNRSFFISVFSDNKDIVLKILRVCNNKKEYLFMLQSIDINVQHEVKY